MEIFHASPRLGRGIGVNHDGDGNALLSLAAASDLRGVTRAEFGIARKSEPGQVLENGAFA